MPHHGSRGLGDARLLSSTGLAAHRRYRARSDATGVSPAPTKCSETAAVSAHFIGRWIWFSLDQIETQQLENSQLPASPGLLIPDTGLTSIQPGAKWSYCSQVNSPDSRVLSLHWSQWIYLWFTPVQMKPKPGCLDWTERIIRPCFFEAFITHNHYLKHLNRALLPSPFSTWPCKFLRPKAVFYYSVIFFTPSPPSQAGPSLYCHTNNALSPASPSGSSRD